MEFVTVTNPTPTSALSSSFSNSAAAPAPPTAASTTTSNSPGRLMVRANLYLRSRDLPNRSAVDNRLLTATLNADVFPLDNIRGLCDVRHRDLIGDGNAPSLAQWKKQPDHFYFHSLFDRYIHRLYDVIPTDKLRNAPPAVVATLKKRYSFIVAEPGMQSDLCDVWRGCSACNKWVSR